MIPAQKKIRQGPSVKQAQQLIAEKKEAAWVALAEQYGNHFMYQGTLVTCDPEVIEPLLMERVHTERRSVVYRLLYKMIPLAHGLLFLDGEAWRKRLHAVMPVFTRPNVNGYVSFMHQYLQDIIGQWKRVEYFSDLYATVVRMNAGLLMKAGYGLDPDTMPAKQLAEILVQYKFDLMDPDSRIDEFGMSVHTLQRLPRFIRAEWKRGRKKKQLRALIAQVVSNKAFLENDGLNWIKSLHDSGFNTKAIADEVNHLYGAYNALDYTITCALYQLGRNPAWVERLKHELRITDELPIGITHKDFQKIPDTVHFMQEVFRYYPVSMGISRRTGDEIIKDTVHIPAGQEVLIALYALHHHPAYWENPEHFDPDRWKEIKPVPYSYIPFLKGPRHCIGRHLAELNFINFIRVWILNGKTTVPDEPMHLAAFMIPRFEKELGCSFTKH